jgi:8-oxo-dGTP pyrophosphatase MutT (NUDIX family)
VAQFQGGKAVSKAWKVLSSKDILKTSIFRFRSDTCELPDGRVMPNYYVLEFPDWVNIVPVTDDGKIVLVEQQRHAAGDTFLEIPGGSLDPRTGEDTKRAVLRELVEETGYVPDDLRLIGVHHPNPAMQNNKMHTYIGFGCRQLEKQNLDPFEDITVVLKEIPEVIELILTGKLTHTIVIASLLYALPVLGFSLPRK